jgi:pyroglutamyl-peptidase
MSSAISRAAQSTFVERDFLRVREACEVGAALLRRTPPAPAPYPECVRRPLVLVTGFGPFERVRSNPSRAIAAALERRPPEGVRVRACELPVSFVGAPREVERFVARHAAERPVLLLGLGVQKLGYFRFERRARGRYTTKRIDNDGTAGADLRRRVGPDRRTKLDLRSLARLLRSAGARDVRVSNDAGGYVCERTYHALLTAGAKHGIDAVFLHVPPAKVTRASVQARLVREWLGCACAGERTPALGN